MQELISKMEYVEYLLKNYHRILNDLEQMKIELEHYEIESVEETIEGMSLGRNEIQSGDSFKDGTARVAMVFRNVNKRINLENKKRIMKQIAAGEIEFKKLRAAIGYLPEDTKNVIEDLYIKRLKWDRIAMTRYISNNTINRHRKKGIEEIARAFFMSEGAA